ncbi:MAG: molybdopterin-guanine dinucleotide biosynthesis protein B, partial [Campylobacterota bacterium]|nr:molybdopterin-guanine dinucleotide biosynthesis protein B [Campylobacterota bacterium]
MNKNRLAVAFTGPSNSGKTTLIIKLSNLLQKQNYKVAIIKHDPMDKATFDKEGKDSYKFSNTGAQVAVVSPKKTTIFKKETSSIDEIVKSFNEFDFLLVEGLKTLPLPRICIQRDEINENYFDVSDTIATNDSIEKSKLPKDMKILNLDDINEIVMWIKEN